MAGESPYELLVGDPLREVTRKERRALLGFCAIAIVVVKTGLIPNKIVALGIEFSSADQKSLLVVLALVVLYFLVAFLIYAFSDFMAWRISLGFSAEELAHKHAEKQIELFKYGGKKVSEAVEELSDSIKKQIFSEGESGIKILRKPMSYVRLLFDIVFPTILGIYTIIMLLWY
ncbi:MAG: hypothetical protein ACM3YF_06120 [Candidatus Zixiibacteriota bacterium]